jgi:hypothetical protein
MPALPHSSHLTHFAAHDELLLTSQDHTATQHSARQLALHCYPASFLAPAVAPVPVRPCSTASGTDAVAVRQYVATPA